MCALGTLTERSRVEWRLADTTDATAASDPLHLLEEVLASHGLPVRDLSRPSLPLRADAVYGAVIFVSAAASARAVGAPPGPPSPSLSVPDLAVVTYDRGGVPGEPSPRPETGPPGGWRLGPWEPSWTPARHAAAVDAARRAIGRGDVYQVNVVGHARAPYAGDPMPALRRLAGLPGAVRGGLLTGDGWALASASPEALLDVRAGRATTRPIKGTRRADPSGRRDLLASAKERAEHIMIVDLVRNDLARVARTGGVRVDRLYALRRWCDLWQAESTVSAALADGVGLAALLRAVCPAGSVTGAPKLAALSEIARLEPVGRGASMGALGWVGHDGIRLGLTIRTVAADRGHLHLWAGGGITWGSEPEAEVAEAAAKAAPLRAALAGDAAPGAYSDRS
jgi:para-aminobenzoate synthetase component 1